MINTENYFNLKYDTEYESIFNEFYPCNEPVDVKKIMKVISSGWNKFYDEDTRGQTWLQESGFKHRNAQKHLKCILRNVSDGMINTQLKCNGAKGIGRASYKNYVSLSSLPGELRQYISRKSYVDFDMENCHFSILNNICKKAKVPKWEFQNLSNYVKNREEVLETSIKKHFFDRDCVKVGKNMRTVAQKSEYKKLRKIIKTLYIRIQFLGSYEQWLSEYEIPNGVTDGNIVILRNEIQNICQKYIVPNNQAYYNRLSAEIKKKNKKKKKEGGTQKNPLSSMAARFTQHYERIIIEQVLRSLMKEKVITNNRFVYCFDGFQLTKPDAEKTNCEKLQLLTKKLTGFKIKWTIKDFSDGEKLNTLINKTIEDRNNLIEHPVNFCGEFNATYFKSLKGNYPMMKSYFELFISFVECPEPLFWKIENKVQIDHETGDKGIVREITHHSRIQLKEIYGRYGSGSFDSLGNEKKFFKIWIDDENIKTYKSLDFVPKNCTYENIGIDKDYLNTFCGYPDLIFNTKTPDEPDMIKKIIKPYLDVLINVIGGDEEDLEHFLMMIAYKIKYPSRKLPYTIVIMGLEGEGKNVILDVIGNVIGTEHYITTSKIGDIVDTHSEGLYHKLIANMNEMGFGDSEKYANLLKSLCSENTMVINPKNVRPFKIHNHALLIITSNENLPIKLDILNSERRNVILKGNGKNINKYKGKGVWRKLVEYFRKPVFLASLYKYLMTMKVESFDFKLAKRMNEKKPAYNSVAQYFYPAEMLFMKDFINLGKFHQNPIDEQSDDDCLISDDELDVDYKEEHLKVKKVADDYFKSVTFEYEWGLKPVKTYCDYPDFTEIKTFRLKKFLENFREWCQYNGFKWTAENKNCKKFANKIFNLKLPLIKGTNSKNQTIVKFNPSDLLLALYNKKIVEIDTTLDWYATLTIKKENEDKALGKGEISLDDLDLMDI